MRRAVLFPLLTGGQLFLAGCHIVFPLDDEGSAVASRRPPFSAQVAEESRLRVTLPATVQIGDYIVGTLQSNSFSNMMKDLPVGWEILDDYPDGDCTNEQWHAWIVAGQANAAEEVVDFILENNDTISGLFVPYFDVSAVSNIRKQTPKDSSTAGTATFAASESSPGTIMYISVMANEQTPADPAGMTRIAGIGNIVAFDQALPDGRLPEVVVEVPAGFCLGASQVKVER